MQLPAFYHFFKNHKDLISLLREFTSVSNQIDKDLLDSLDVYLQKTRTFLPHVSELNVELLCGHLFHQKYSLFECFSQVVIGVVDGKHLVLD